MRRTVPLVNPGGVELLGKPRVMVGPTGSVELSGSEPQDTGGTKRSLPAASLPCSTHERGGSKEQAREKAKADVTMHRQRAEVDSGSGIWECLFPEEQQHADAKNEGHKRRKRVSSRG